MMTLAAPAAPAMTINQRRTPFWIIPPMNFSIAAASFTRGKGTEGTGTSRNCGKGRMGRRRGDVLVSTALEEAEWVEGRVVR